MGTINSRIAKFNLILPSGETKEIKGYDEELPSTKIDYDLQFSIDLEIAEQGFTITVPPYKNL